MKGPFSLTLFREVLSEQSAADQLDSAQRHRAAIWPDAVIVLNNVSVTALNEHSLAPRIIGLPVRFEIEPTLDPALRHLYTAKKAPVFVRCPAPPLPASDETAITFRPQA